MKNKNVCASLRLSLFSHRLMLRSPRLVKRRQWCLIAPVPMTIRITGANFSSSPSRHHIMSCDAQVRAWNAYTPYAFIQRYVSLSGRFEILRNVGFPTGRKRRRCCGKRKKKPSCGKSICFLDYFKKTEKCMLGNGSPHLGGAPSRGNQITLKVYQPSFIRLSARDVPASRMQEELATLMVGINHW